MPRHEIFSRGKAAICSSPDHTNVDFKLSSKFVSVSVPLTKNKESATSFYLIPARSPSLSSHDPLTMTISSFPQELYEAARVYPNSCTAYANFSAADDFIALRIQAPEIMMQFVGDVDFGKGIPSHFLGLSDV